MVSENMFKCKYEKSTKAESKGLTAGTSKIHVHVHVLFSVFEEGYVITCNVARDYFPACIQKFRLGGWGKLKLLKIFRGFMPRGF